MASAKLKAAFTAAFQGDSASVYAASERRVRRLDLVPDRAGRTREAWSASLPHASHLAPDPSGCLLIVTDTAGTHHGLCAADGSLLWETPAFGEGDGGLFLDDGTFLFIDWGGGVRRLDPETGRETRAPAEIGSQVRGVQRLGTAGMLAFVRLGTAPDPGSPISHRFCAYDPGTGAVDVLLEDCASHELAASPDGTRVALVETVRVPDAKPAHRPRRLAIIELSTGSVVRERCFAGPERPRSAPVWSADGRLLICASAAGYHVLDAGRLDRGTLVPSRYGYKAALSPDGTLVFLCDWESPKLLRLEDLRPV